MTDGEVIAHALTMWANYIETSDVTLSANDAIERRKVPNRLTDDQRNHAARLRQLAKVPRWS